MSDSSDSSDRPPAQRRRGLLISLAGAVAALLLVLGVTGTLSSWTSAVIDNNNNSVASTNAVALHEEQTSPVNPSALPCDTASSTTNAVTCSDINKYGGIGSAATGNDSDAYGAPLDPDGVNSQSVTVALANDGTAAGTLSLAAGTCTHAAYPGSTGTDLGDYNLCDVMQLDATCTDSTFSYSGVVDAFDGGSIGSLAPTASTQCTFTVTLPSGTPAGYAGQYLTQDLTWTLTSVT